MAAAATQGNLMTFIARATDSMMLVASLDVGRDLEEHKNNAKRVLKSINDRSPSRCTIDAGNFYFHYIVENSVVYLCLAQRSYPKKLAFQYLEELARSFSIDHGSEVPKYSRPYAAVNFDPKMAKIRREYLDQHSTKNVNKLAADLTDIHNILVRNIQDVMQRGEKLDSMEQMSSSLVSDSKKFEKTSKYVNLQYLYRTYGPLVIVLLVVLLVLYFRFLR